MRYCSSRAREELVADEHRLPVRRGGGGVGVAEVLVHLRDHVLLRGGEFELSMLGLGDLAALMLPEQERDADADAGGVRAREAVGIVVRDADVEIGQEVLLRERFAGRARRRSAG